MEYDPIEDSEVSETESIYMLSETETDESESESETSEDIRN